MRPARLCRARTTPTWFGRAPLHAAAISCCVLPVARTRTCSPRVGVPRLPPAGFKELLLFDQLRGHRIYAHGPGLAFDRDQVDFDQLRIAELRSRLFAD